MLIGVCGLERRAQPTSSQVIEKMRARCAGAKKGEDRRQKAAEGTATAEKSSREPRGPNQPMAGLTEPKRTRRVPAHVVDGKMIITEQYQTRKKYIKLQAADFEEFLFEDSGTSSPPSTPLSSHSGSFLSVSISSSDSETSRPPKRMRVDEEAFQSSSARDLIKQILQTKPGGTTVIEEYEETGTLCDSRRRQMVNILAAHMVETEGRIPQRVTKEKYALGIVTLFPALKDPFSRKGYIHQYFSLLFGPDTAAKLLEKWHTSYKRKVIQEAESLTTTPVQSLLRSGKNQHNDDKKKSQKISAAQAMDHLVVFHKSCRSLEEHLEKKEGQPYLLASGTCKQAISTYYVVMDKNLIPCQGTTPLAAFDELFKVHFVFSVSYDDALSNMYTFLQTTAYNFDVDNTKESPKVKELRAKFTNKS
ncbi:uncharacterized protein [Pagrus major]|uniref:uncharacterized protein n=1 Tax=Pagrus major TaxID=143350 RepID=UPI003CC86767